jgi:hypothetical protein
MVYQDPLAYLLGIEGVALLDAWAGDHDRAFTDARLSEIRRLLDDEKLRDRGVQVERVSTVTAYEQWSAGYDAEAAGGLFAADEPVVAGFLASREPGVGLDAACRTGRFAEFLSKRGHRRVGSMPASHRSWWPGRIGVVSAPPSPPAPCPSPHSPAAVHSACRPPPEIRPREAASPAGPFTTFLALSPVLAGRNGFCPVMCHGKW